MKRTASRWNPALNHSRHFVMNIFVSGFLLTFMTFSIRSSYPSFALINIVTLIALTIGNGLMLWVGYHFLNILLYRISTRKQNRQPVQ